jgi:uncharacterized phage-like protein YoqJ
VTKKIIFGTGHRPHKLIGGWTGWRNHYREIVQDFCIPILEEENVAHIISGMALGWDFAIAKSAIEMNIPFSAYIPCKNQEMKWSKEDQDEYKFLISKAADVQYISEKYSSFCMQKRNEAMALVANEGLALWNGDLSGGTFNCISFCKKNNIKVKNLWKIYLELFQ